MGLVDRIGGIAEAVDVAVKMAGITDEDRIRLLLYPKRRSLLQRIRDGDLGIRGAATEEVRDLLEAYGFDGLDILPYGERHGMYWAYMPFTIRD